MALMQKFPQGQGVPDCIWYVGDTLYISFEAKTEQTPGYSICISDVRQAQGHSNWIRANRDCGPEATILCVIVTPREQVAAEALPHGQELFRVGPDEVRKLAQTVVSVLRGIRSQTTPTDEQSMIKAIQEELVKRQLRVLDIIQRFSQQPLIKLPVVK